MNSGKTVRELLDRYNGSAPGFDALRLILAIVIMLWHTVYVCYGRYTGTYDLVWSHPLVQPVLRAILPMFFFLGGFLVTGSAYRVRQVGPFLVFRVLRIVPALLVEITLSAIVLGGLVTALPLKEYYAHPQFFSYFLNTFGLVHFRLPGVFGEHPSDVVNINLWTLPPDFHGYAIMAVLIAAGFIFHRRVFLAVFALMHVFLFAGLATFMNWGASGTVFVHPHLLIYSFFLGAFCYVFADRIRITRSGIAVALLSVLFFEIEQTTFLGLIGACYLTLCIGFTDLRRFPLIRRGDYSYGIYLYGFPIEQAVWHYMPFAREWWSLYLVALPLTLVFSVLSWHWIEKPCLGLKRRLIRSKAAPAPDQSAPPPSPA